MTCLGPARRTLDGNTISTTINITAINQPVSIMLPPASQTRRAGSPPGAIRAEAEAKAAAGCGDEQAPGRQQILAASYRAIHATNPQVSAVSTPRIHHREQSHVCWAA
jgi:hypothetical protein